MFSEATILVLTDKSGERQDLAHILSDRYRVIEAESYEEGLGKLSGGVDLVVADLDVSPSRVMELLRRTKTEQPETPVLVVTGGDDVHAAVRAMKSGAVDCLVKPVDREVLWEIVSELLVDRSQEISERPVSDLNRITKHKHSMHIDIPPGTSLEDLERAAVEQALAQHQGNRTHAAKTLGISVRTLQRKLKAWGMPIMAVPPHSQGNNYLLSASGGHSVYSAHAHSAH